MSPQSPSSSAPTPGTAEQIAWYVGRLFNVLTVFGAAVAVAFAVAQVLTPLPAWLSGVLREALARIGVTAPDAGAVAALGNVGLSGAGATLVLALRPKLPQLLSPVRDYLRGGQQFLASVLEPALVVFAVSTGAFVGLLSANIEISRQRTPSSYAKVRVDPSAVRQLIDGLNAASGPSSVQALSAALAQTTVKVDLSSLRGSDALNVVASVDLLDGKTRSEMERLTRELGHLASAIASMPAFAASRELNAIGERLTSIDQRLGRINAHVSSLAPRSLSEER